MVNGILGVTWYPTPLQSHKSGLTSLNCFTQHKGLLKSTDFLPEENGTCHEKMVQCRRQIKAPTLPEAKLLHHITAFPVLHTEVYFLCYRIMNFSKKIKGNDLT